jgi:hypothetical protein
VATILILQALARRWRRSDDTDADVPYGPQQAPRDVAGGGART